MPVFIRDRLRVLYVHVPKTGGTAIEQFFEKNGFDVFYLDNGGETSLVPLMRCSPQHLHAEPLQALFHVDRFSYRFMTVRHPVARLVSEYRMRAAQQRVVGDVDAWVARVLDTYATDPFVVDNHVRPQVDYRLPDCDVFRHEDGYGAAWIGRLAERLSCDFGYPQVEVAMRFPGTPRPTPGAATLARIRAFYRADFTAFGYDPAAA